MSEKPVVGWHFQALPGDIVNLVKGCSPRGVKIVNPPNENPFAGTDIAVVGREWFDENKTNEMVWQGESGSKEWCAALEPAIERCPYIKIWGGPNEPHPPVDAGWTAKPGGRTWSQEWATRSVDFHLAWIAWAKSQGIRPVVGEFSVGWPDEYTRKDGTLIEQYSWFGPLMQPIIDANGFFSTHEYAWPTMQSGDGWYTLRVNRFAEALTAAGYPIPWWIVGECGIDGGVAGRAKEGWKTALAGQEQAEAAYWGQLKTYFEGLAALGFVWLATPFTSGPYGWDDFDVNVTVSQLMASYVASYQSVSPIPEPEPTPEPTPDPAPEPDEPSTDLTLLYNLEATIVESKASLDAALAIVQQQIAEQESTAATLDIIDVTDELPKHVSKVYGERALDDIDYIVLHHSAVRISDSSEAYIRKHLAAIARGHVNKNDWPGIGYHFCVDAEGRIWQVNPITTVSYHVAGHNTESIGICGLGRFDTGYDEPSTKMVESIGRLCAWFDYPVRMHKELVATACPGVLGDRVRAWLEEMQS